MDSEFSAGSQPLSPAVFRRTAQPGSPMRRFSRICLCYRTIRARRRHAAWPLPARSSARRPDAGSSKATERTRNSHACSRRSSRTRVIT